MRLWHNWFIVNSSRFGRWKLSNTLKGLVLASLFTFAWSTQAAELKVGYVQVDKILQEAPQTAESGKKLEREFSPRSQELDRMAKQIKEL